MKALLNLIGSVVRYLRRLLISVYFNNLPSIMGDLQKVIDIGGGEGLICDVIRGVNLYVLMDIDVKSLMGFKGGQCIAERVAGDAQVLPFRSDLRNFKIILHYVLHHLKDPFKCLSEILRISGDGTCTYIRDLDAESFITKVIMYLEKLSGSPANFMSLGKIITYLTSLRLKVTVVKKDFYSYLIKYCY